MPGALVLAAGVAQPHDQQIQRRGTLAPTEEAHSLFLGGFLLAGGALRPRQRPSPSGGLALRSLLALGHLALGQLELPRPRPLRARARRTWSASSRSRARSPRDRRGTSRPPAPAGRRGAACRRCHPVTSRSRCSGTSSGSASTVISRTTCERTPPSVTPTGSPISSTTTRAYRFVEAHLLQVDVGERALDRILLVLLEDRRARRLLAVERDVEDRVQARTARQRAPELALGDGKRVRFLPAPVEDAGNQPLLAQAAHSRVPRLSRSSTRSLTRSPATAADCSYVVGGRDEDEDVESGGEGWEGPRGESLPGVTSIGTIFVFGKGLSLERPPLKRRTFVSCPSCRRENADSARFCVSCGTALRPACAECGAEVRPGRPSALPAGLRSRRGPKPWRRAEGRHRPLRRPRRLHHPRRAARPRGHARPALAVLRARARGARALRRHGREVHRRRGDGALRRADGARGRPRARGPRRPRDPRVGERAG